MKIIVIGKNGNLGRYLMQALEGSDHIGLGREDLDITNAKRVSEIIATHKPDAVINATAYNAVDQAETDPQAQLVNGLAPGLLAAACKANNALLVHYGTGMVFDGSNASGYNEIDRPNPVNAYGQSKLLGESEIQKHTDKYYVLRTCWLYGRKGAGSSNKKSFTDVMIDASTSGSVKAVNDEFGNPTFMQDLAQATAVFLEQSLPYGIYHVVNEGVASRLDWTQEIFKLKNIKAEIKPVLGSEFIRPAKRPKYEVLNNNKFIKMRPWQEALEEYLTNF